MLTDHQRQQIVLFLLDYRSDSLEPRDGKWYFHVEPTGSLLLSNDRLPIDMDTGNCAEHHKRLIDPVLLDWLVARLKQDREEFASPPVEEEDQQLTAAKAVEQAVEDVLSRTEKAVIGKKTIKGATDEFFVKTGEDTCGWVKVSGSSSDVTEV